MKKILFGILFSIVFIQNVYAGYIIQTPDWRILGDYPINTPFETIAKYIENDRNQYGLQNYIYRVYPNTYGVCDYFYTIGTLAYTLPQIDAYRGEIYILNTNEDIHPNNENKLYEGPNIIYAPTYKNITEEVNKYWTGNTGILYPFSLNKIEQDKPKIKALNHAKIIYSPEVQYLEH